MNYGKTFDPISLCVFFLTDGIMSQAADFLACTESP